MAAWSSDIKNGFISTRPELEPDFTPAAYNKLLNNLFPVNTPFTVFPNVHLHQQSSVPDTRATFTVYYGKSPVFLLDINAYSSLPRISSREAADGRIRRHMRDLLPYCPLPALHGVSVFGTRMAFYKAGPAWSNVLPARTCTEGAGELEDTTPVDWWDCDLLEDDGAIRLKEVVNRIRNECDNLS
ncbi:hypothetical protein D9613_009207 [Agrocybe pediades]|uniref:Uncharacterized protein n=1 Tax=Agrocybe pediades TaxID=84607 RepID=A0A8H4R2M2_9AGAR|nr:hypothetical protein D9613_009207 [Agrocybe pediades]